MDCVDGIQPRAHWAMTKIKYEKVPNLPEIEVVGTSPDSAPVYAGNLELPGEFNGAFLSEDPAAKDGGIRSVETGYGWDHADILYVQKRDVEVAIELIGGFKSPIHVTFHNVYVHECDGLLDVFAEYRRHRGEYSDLEETRKGMSQAHPECCNKYKVVDVEGGRRVVFRYLNPIA